MKRLDASETGIFGINWSADGEWISYVRGEDEVCIVNSHTGDLRVIGPGACPSVAKDNTVLMERDETIVAVSGSGERVLFKKDDLVKESPKRLPLLSPDGNHFIFTVNNVFDKTSQSKNAYPYRHFLAVGSLDGKKPVLTGQQWYGGTFCWFPDGSMFTHYEFDSTGGARIHVCRKDGEELGSVFGLYPSVSPDGKRIACKPRNGGNVVVYANKGEWAEKDIDTSVHKLPQSQGRMSATPPQWLDNRFVLIDEGGHLFRVDTRKDDATEMKKLPLPSQRGQATMVLSPDRERLACETEGENGFELCVAPVS